MLGHGDAVNEISYHPVWPSIIASASKDLTVRLWHVPSQTPIAIFGGFQGHQDQILSLVDSVLTMFLYMTSSRTLITLESTSCLALWIIL